MNFKKIDISPQFSFHPATKAFCEKLYEAHSSTRQTRDTQTKNYGKQDQSRKVFEFRSEDGRVLMAIERVER